MENINIDPKNRWTVRERKLISWIALILGSAALIFFVAILIPKIARNEQHFTPVPIPETVGINAQDTFQFTLSPDNQWILYFENKYPYLDQYNLMAYDTVNNKKFAIDTGDIFSGLIRVSMQNDCWSKDSHYCVLPVGKPFNDPTILSEPRAMDTPADAPWLLGSQLVESEFADANSGVAVGYINNAPDILIDFTGPNGPILKKQYFNSKQVQASNTNGTAPVQTNRLTFDQISPNGFGCSDCSVTASKEKVFGNNSHGYELVSPDGRFIAKQISQGDGIVTPPDLYITDTKTGNDYLVAPNVYYDMHFTSDSARLYYYGCKTGGACDGLSDPLFYVDLVETLGSNNKMTSNNNEVPEIPAPLHTSNEQFRDLAKIQKSENDEQQAVLKAHYDLLTEEFKTPQKIIGTNVARIFTEHYRPVIMINDENPGVPQYNEDLIQSLIGKKVTIVLPSFQEFSKKYGGADMYDTNNNDGRMWIGGANDEEVYSGPIPTDPVYKKYIWTSYAKVYYNGKLLVDGK